ncbi:MAG TPA: adenylyl-sulfate kinase [Opitutaceae bacterium]|nr:adenylyl-sulfate kinase [Opitutaceae bacterium]
MSCPAPAPKAFWTASHVTAGARAARHGHAGCVVWFTGLSGAGKSTVATALEHRLFEAGRQAYLLDGDNLRHGLCSDLDFSAAGRTENIRRASEVARLFADAGMICLAAFISPRRADREHARGLLPAHRFIEVFVDTPIEVCRRRDPKGLYARADRGEIPEFTGVSAPYEPPLRPEITLRTDRETVEACVERILERLAAAQSQP